MTTYYVATTGSDSGNGSSSSPFRTIAKAMRIDLKPGDEVVVRAGTYNEMVRISKNGSADQYIVLRSEKPGAAKITPPSDKDYGIHIAADYVQVDGFEISGARKAGITANLVHHVKITNNESHDNKAHGISATRSDFVTIEGNVTYDNASVGARSGISVFQPQNINGDTSSKGFRIIVRDNISYDNVTKTGAHSDGNGIIMDDFRSTKAANSKAYLFPSLVENNVVYNNGGKGIQVAWSDYVTVRNNTSWHNNVDPIKKGTWHGELSNMNSSNNTWVNNIAVTDKAISGNNTAIDSTSFKNYTNKNVTWANNLTYNGKTGDASIRTTGSNEKPSAGDGNLLGVDPQFVSAGSNFELRSGSAAIDAGTKAYGYSSSGIDSGARSGAPDIGAYEFGSGSGGAAGSSGGGSSGSGGDTGGTGSGGSTQPPVDETPVEEPEEASGVTGKTTGTTGTARNDSLTGGSGNDSVRGYGGDDTLDGGGGRDFVVGGGGRDVLMGGAGEDRLAGGPGGDTFTFRSTGEAGKGSSADTIRDFWSGHGDKIDLSGIDAVAGQGGNQAFTYIGSKGFSGKAGELQYRDGKIAGNINGDRNADFNIEIGNDPAMKATDFIL